MPQHLSLIGSNLVTRIRSYHKNLYPKYLRLIPSQPLSRIWSEFKNLALKHLTLIQSYLRLKIRKASINLAGKHMSLIPGDPNPWFWTTKAHDNNSALQHLSLVPSHPLPRRWSASRNLIPHYLSHILSHPVTRIRYNHKMLALKHLTPIQCYSRLKVMNHHKNLIPQHTSLVPSHPVTGIWRYKKGYKPSLKSSSEKKSELHSKLFEIEDDEHFQNLVPQHMSLIIKNEKRRRSSIDYHSEEDKKLGSKRNTATGKEDKCVYAKCNTQELVSCEFNNTSRIENPSNKIRRSLTEKDNFKVPNKYVPNSSTDSGKDSTRSNTPNDIS
ncbi:unnamed protein product [Lepeophtheirus salmonis]|uniref:(salmon louse) hypothetical protein n=1 Tax=Lepeophtheirus salmonis TaxID=72036 RepID=A0A7R8D2P7_LEPSM|nr:unnamed protein product [Lepeophtheirus salmonis]CAF3007134.1 unnamed protein product [Lepeophtheirus salmonis]